MNTKKVSIITLIVLLIIVGAVALTRKGTNSTAPSSSSLSLPTTTALQTTTTTASSSISVSSQNFYSNGSFSFTYPNGWTVARYSPFSMTNFNDTYGTGGILPPGGATITVVTTTAYGQLKDIITTELMSAMDITTTTLTLDAIPCPAYAYTVDYAADAASKDVSVYCQRGSELWKIYLSYNASDTPAMSPVGDFNSVLASMKFL